MGRNVMPANNPVPTRRDLLFRLGGGFAGLALVDLLARDGFFAGRAVAEPRAKPDLASPLAPRQPHFAAKAKQVVFLFMNGRPATSIPSTPSRRRALQRHRVQGPRRSAPMAGPSVI